MNVFLHKNMIKKWMLCDFMEPTGKASKPRKCSDTFQHKKNNGPLLTSDVDDTY
jgi:hypothetical protein